MQTPQTLWHYTTAEGLFGIVKESSLRFGDATFMNDRTERTYGHVLLEQALRDRLASDPDDLTKPFREILKVLTVPDRLYVCSFSENEESISQWQRYGAGGDGYCIGFDVRRLDRCFERDPVTSVPMLYAVEEQRTLLHRAVDACYAEYLRLKGEEKRRSVTYFEYLFLNGEIDSALLRLKNPFFHDEREWRYLLSVTDDGVPPDGTKEEWTVRGSFLKPFVQLPRKRRSVEPRLPIVEVICGPRLESDLASAAVERFLASHRYQDVAVKSSALTDIWR